MSAVGVQAVRGELLKVKEEAKSIQSTYKVKAEQRVAYQNKMAKLNEMIQLRSKEVMLVEDVIVVTLAAETEAQERYSHLEPPTKKAEPVVVGQTTKSAEDAIRIYNSQIEELKEEIEYRTQMTMAETDMDIIYRAAVDDILDIMDAFCEDGRLRIEITRYSSGGSAPSSPRKPPRKGSGRSLAAPTSMLFAHSKSPLDDNDAPKTTIENTDGIPKFGAPPLFIGGDSDENDNKGKDSIDDVKQDDNKNPDDDESPPDDRLEEKDVGPDEKDGVAAGEMDEKETAAPQLVDDLGAPVTAKDDAAEPPTKTKKKKKKKTTEKAGVDVQLQEEVVAPSDDAPFEQQPDDTAPKKKKKVKQDDEAAPPSEEGATTKKKTKKVVKTNAASPDDAPEKKKKKKVKKKEAEGEE
jgi:hypothetical protein